MELRRVVPPRRRLPTVVLAAARKPNRMHSPVQSTRILGERGAKADLDAGADRELNRVRAYLRRRAMAARSPSSPATAGLTLLPNAPRDGSRQSLVDIMGRAMLNSRASLGSIPAPLSSTK